MQEILQAISPQSPNYPIVDAAGPEHQKHFAAKIVWCDLELGFGRGRSKKEAEVDAARNALKQQLWKSVPVPNNVLNNSPTTTGAAE